MQNKYFTYLCLASTFCIILFVTDSFAQNPAQPFTSSKCNEFTFDATGSYDQEGGKLTYEWNFGDGISSNEPVVTHTYAEAGVYTVTLKISDDEGLSSHSTQKVLVNIPPTVSLIAPDKVCINEAFAMDASASFDRSTKKLKFVWDFGDGTTAGNKETVSKVYRRGGNFKVRMTADDQSGVICSAKTLEHVIRVNEPPSADAGPPEMLICVSKDEDFNVSFDAAATYDINGDDLTYSWDFGDLSPIATGERLTHRFKDFGLYDVKLMVNDNTDMGCGSSVDFVKVQINEAPKAEAGEDAAVCPGERVVFDGTGSYANPPGTIIGQWLFGDGLSANGLRVFHTYTKPGEYNARLMIESKLNPTCPPSSDSKTVSVNAPPTVTLKSDSIGCTDTTMHFEASSADADGDELEYYWSFGDGTILRGEKKVSHVYDFGGNYQVSVIVDDKKGTACSTATASKTVTINTPPTADAGVNQSCCVDVPATFDASASSDPDGHQLTYMWDFGDGNKAAGAVVTHTYKKNGKFDVTLTVDDHSGTACSRSTDSFSTEIHTTPVPVINIR